MAKPADAINARVAAEILNVKSLQSVHNAALRGMLNRYSERRGLLWYHWYSRADVEQLAREWGIVSVK